MKGSPFTFTSYARIIAPLRRWQSGQLQETVNLPDIVLRRFKSCPAHQVLYKNQNKRTIPFGSNFEGQLLFRSGLRRTALGERFE